MNDLDIKKIIEINAPVDIVFKAITNPDELTQWFPDHVILEPKVGGKMKFSFFANGKSSKMIKADSFSEGEILEFIPNEKLSYTWRSEKIPNSPRTIVTWNLEVIDKNKTKLTLSHTGFSSLDKEPQSGFVNGWAHFCNQLISYCSKQ